MKKNTEKKKNINKKGGKGDRVLVTLLLDRSASMESIREETVAGLNVYVDELRASKADVRLSLVFFDSPLPGELDLVKKHVATPVGDVAPLTCSEFEPRGGTPLIDASMEVISAVEASLDGRKKSTKVVIAIQTDGEENTSRKHTWSDLREKISMKEAEGWQFVFLGAGINAFDQGRKMGISSTNTLSYGLNAEHTRAAFKATGENISSYASGDADTVAYTPEQSFRSAEDEVLSGINFDGSPRYADAFLRNGPDVSGYFSSEIFARIPGVTDNERRNEA